MPTESEETDTAAIPLTTVTGPAPSVALPFEASTKVTVPDAATFETVAVNVTLVPKVDGLKEETSVVVVALSTCWVMLGESLPSNVESPL